MSERDNARLELLQIDNRQRVGRRTMECPEIDDERVSPAFDRRHVRVAVADQVPLVALGRFSAIWRPMRRWRAPAATAKFSRTFMPLL